MTYEINETHDPSLKSWVESANDSNTDFPIQNLPLCIHNSSKVLEIPSIGMPIGDQLLDLGAIDSRGLIDGTGICLLDSIGEGVGTWSDDPGLDWHVAPLSLESAIRARVSGLLRHDSSELRDHPRVKDCFIPLAQVEFLKPIEAIGDYDKVLALNRLMFVAVRGHPMQQVIYGAIDAINRIQFGERIRFVVSSARPREEQWAGRTTSWAEINFVTRNVKPSPTTPSE